MLTSLFFTDLSSESMMNWTVLAPLFSSTDAATIFLMPATPRPTFFHLNSKACPIRICYMPSSATLLIERFKWPQLSILSVHTDRSFACG